MACFLGIELHVVSAEGSDGSWKHLTVIGGISCADRSLTLGPEPFQSY